MRPHKPPSKSSNFLTYFHISSDKYGTLRSRTLESIFDDIHVQRTQSMRITKLMPFLAILISLQIKEVLYSARTPQKTYGNWSSVECHEILHHALDQQIKSVHEGESLKIRSFELQPFGVTSYVNLVYLHISSFFLLNRRFQSNIWTINYIKQ